MSQKNVLYIAPSVGIGGVETFLKHIQAGHTDAVNPIFLVFKNGALSDYLEDHKCKVYYCPSSPRLSRPWTWLSYTAVLFRIINKENIHIVHSSMSYAALFSWLSALKTKHVWFQHGPVSGWMDVWAYRLPHSAVYYNSEFTKHAQLKICNKIMGSSKDIVLPLGTASVSLTDKKAKRAAFIKKYNLSDGTTILTIACRLQRWKGLHITIEAFKKLNPSENIALFIFGDHSWDQSYIEELKKMTQGQKNIHFEKSTTQISDVFISSDIVINSSVGPEPFGLTLIEAMACGAVPVGPDIGGPSEILSDLPECLFESNNSESLKNTLSKIIDDKNLLVNLQERSYDIFQKKYTLDLMINSIEKTYSKL